MHELKALGRLHMHSPEVEDAYLHKLHSSRWWGRREGGQLGSGGLQDQVAGLPGPSGFVVDTISPPSEVSPSITRWIKGRVQGMPSVQD